MPDPADLPTLEDWQATKLATAIELSGYPPNGIQCPESVSELRDVAGTESKADIGGLVLFSISVICPDCGFKGQRYL